jgi:hypothetical protein
MLQLDQHQIDELSELRQREFVLEVVSDWQAAYQSAFSVPANLSLDRCIELAMFLLASLDGLPRFEHAQVEYALIHKVLFAVEQAVPITQIRQAVELFCQALPADEAGFCLLDWMLSDV